eukprot:4729502-Amphidinium_carterae.2
MGTHGTSSDTKPPTSSLLSVCAEAAFALCHTPGLRPKPEVASHSGGPKAPSVREEGCRSDS